MCSCIPASILWVAHNWRNPVVRNQQNYPRSGALDPTDFYGGQMAPRLHRLLRMIGATRNAGHGPTKVDPHGQVFISYRQSDGTGIAMETAWALRAAGVPVWHDRSDLPPGETSRRLIEALESGLSGAVLLVTPEIENSKIIRDIELPRLLELARDKAFTLSVISAVEREPGKLDYSAPDRLLRRRPGTLSALRQDAAGTSAQRADAAHAQSRRRMEAVRPTVEAAGRFLTIDVQTRIPPFATRVNADLVLRLRPPLDGDRRPNREGLQDLAAFLADFPQMLAVAGAEHATIRGGAHLTVAYALGAAMPTTLLGTVDIVDTGGNLWTLSGNAPAPAGQNKLLVVSSLARLTSRDGPLLIYLDLLPQRSDAAFDALTIEEADGFSKVFHIRTVAGGDLVPEEAGALVGEISHIIRCLAGQSRTTEVHLLLRSPWTIALLVGRTLNTMRVHLYEWEDGPDDCGNISEPRYIPSLVVRSGGGGSSIERVSLPVQE